MHADNYKANVSQIKAYFNGLPHNITPLYCNAVRTADKSVNSISAYLQNKMHRLSLT